MTDLAVSLPTTRAAERDYALRVLLQEFLGLSYVVEPGPDGVVVIRRPGDPTAFIALPDVLLGVSDEWWLRPPSLPTCPVGFWDARAELPDLKCCDGPLPVLYPGPPGAPMFRHEGRGIRLNADVFGAAFLMLTRYEELARPVRDGHNRFAAASSLAHREGFLGRPVVNEWLEVLRCCLMRLWPELRFADRRYRLFLTHDVDHPWVARGAAPARLVRSLGADLLVRREPALAVRRTAAYLTGSADADPANRFDWVMDRSEEAGARSTFFFQVRPGTGRYDSRYSLGDSWIRRLLTRINVRGHCIGLHTSYDAYRDLGRTREEADTLRTCCAELGIEQDEWAVRQHYLRWENPTTWHNADESGLDVDSTLSFADHAGFRCGTCYEYPVFDVLRRRRLRLRERPLVAMECSLLVYQGLGIDEAERAMLALAETCRRFAGDFVLLAHNDSLIARRHRRSYRRVVAAQ